MALSNAFYPYAIRLPSPEITHFTSVSADMGYDVIQQTVAGAPSPCYIGVAGSNPSVSFTTQQIKSVLDTCTSNALCRDLSDVTVDMFWRAGKPMDIRESSTASVHLEAQLDQSAMLYWESLSVNQGEVAEISAMLVTAKRGAAEPLVWTDSQQLPVVAGCGNLYGLGEVYLNGTLLQGITGVSISNNVSLEPIRSDGERAITYTGIRSYSPVVSLNSNDLNEIADASYGGDNFSTLEVYLQKMSSTNVYVPAATAEHTKLTFYGGLKTVPSVSGSPGVVTPTFHVIDGPSNPTHAIDTATAMPTVV